MNIEKFRNKLIVFEGLDKQGKSTIAKMLNDYLNQKDISSICTFQPGDIRYGDYATFIRQLCKSKEYNLDTLSNFFAFLFDRAENTAKIVIPAIKEGKTVISDRWWYSTFAYQIYGKELGKRFNLSDDFISQLNLLASHYIEPDIIFYFEKPELEKIEYDKMDLFETESNSFKKRVKEAYIKLAKKYNFVTIQVNPNADETLKIILETI